MAFPASRCAAVLLVAALMSSAAVSTTAAAGPLICVSNTTGAAVATAKAGAPCPPGTASFTSMGANLFDVAWDAWSPSASGTGNLSTSLKAIRDAAASGVSLARFFAVPFAYESTWLWLNASTRDAYWAPLDAVVAEARAVSMSLIPSLGYGCADAGVPCNPARLCPGEVYRDLVVNASSCTRALVFSYAASLIQRYAHSPTILLWELGNEMNLAFDGCSYDKSPGAFYTTAEGLAFLSDYATAVRAADPLGRLVNSGMGAPRLRARHLAATPGGAAACVSPVNPKGDCDLWCPAVEYDTQEDTVAVLSSYYGEGGGSGTDLVSIHWYGCAPPNGNYSWCSGGNATVVPLQVFAAAASGTLDLPLYVGEYGPDAALPGGWGPEPWRGGAYISALAELRVPLSTFWAFECPSHAEMDGLCISPGNVEDNADAFATLEVLQAAQRSLAGLPPANFNLSLYMLPPPVNGSATDPACLDGSTYGYYARVGARTDQWVVMLQGGGWCPSPYDCYERTLPAYAGGDLGSSTHWPSWSWGYWLGPELVDASYLYLPYCDGASYTGSRDAPLITPYGAANSTALYFRGAYNLEAAVRDAMRRFDVSGGVAELVVTGGSAGGLSTTLHVDKLGALMGAETVLGVPQCGFFLEYDEPCFGPKPSMWCNASAQFEATVGMHNATGALPPACTAALPEADAWRCFLAPVVTAFVEAPLFVWNSIVDHFQLNAFVDLPCTLAQAYTPPWLPSVTCGANETAAIVAYGDAFMAAIAPVLAVPGPHRAAFLTSCILHGMDFNLLSVQDSSPMIAFNTWRRAVLHPEDPPTVDNDFKWVEHPALPRTDNPLACPPFTFA